MLITQAATQKKHGDPSAGEALSLGLAFLGVFWVLQSPKHAWLVINQFSMFAEYNELSLIMLAVMILFVFIWTAAAISKLFRKKTSDHDFAASHSKRHNPILSPLHGALLGGSISASALFVLTNGVLAPHRLDLLPIKITAAQWHIFYTCVGFITSAALSFTLTIFSADSMWIFPLFRKKLPLVPQIRDGIILGSIHEAETKTDAVENTKKGLFPNWLAIGLKGLTGNLFISGAIGSGKSQVILQFLRQLLGNFKVRPALLAIDPKRTFVRELRRIIESQGMADHLVWLSLKGDVRLNPIWCENMLKNSAFTTIANSLKLASINFIGGSGDSRFWEQSSFNLLKNSLVYCAARYDYFTFKELYRALVQARDQGLASELVDCLNENQWDEEERGNIEGAIEYFTNEFSQMDEKIRTSILATATGFLNDFLEYRVSRILSPRKAEINFTSFKDAVRDGKLICLNIENDALARSIGTLIKLLYQEAVLDRVTDGNLSDARYALLVMDEYQDVATSGGGAGIGDDRYLAKARESKSITIAATQSVSSLENTIKSEAATRELLQGFRSRIFGNTTDPKTIRVFQEPRGTEEVARSSHNFSETSPDARSDLLFGGYDSAKSNVSQGTSTHFAREYPVTAKEFSRLRTFESFAQVFDGLETIFEKLYLKPYYLKDFGTPHSKILAGLRESAQVEEIRRGRFTRQPFVAPVIAILLTIPLTGSAGILFPNICSVAKTSQFRSCLNLSIGACVCGYPLSHPCASISYYVPQTFIEVWPNSKQSFFSKYPGTAVQLGLHPDNGIPFGEDDEMGGFSFQAHAIAIPLANEILSPLSCGGTRTDKVCFDLMSEDLGSNWSTGAADSLQPSFLAWSLSPKACLLKGAVAGVIGIGDISIGGDMGGCSYPLSFLPKYPPSTHDTCNGWGIFYPRSGIYQGSSRTGAALMIAARLKSLGIEVSHTIPGDLDEVWQMIYPQSSSCFKEGENIGFLEAIKGVREEQRLLGKPNGYLFVIWKRVSCCKEFVEIAKNELALQAISLGCQVVPGGDI